MLARRRLNTTLYLYCLSCYSLDCDCDAVLNPYSNLHFSFDLRTEFFCFHKFKKLKMDCIGIRSQLVDWIHLCNICLLPSNTTTLIKYPGYRMSLYYICFRLYVSAVKRPSSGLYRASHVKYNGFGTFGTLDSFDLVVGTCCRPWWIR